MTHGRNVALVLASLISAAGLLAASCAPATAPAPTAKPPAAKTEPTAAPKAAATQAPLAPAATPKPASEQPRSGGILARANPEDPPHLDVHQATSVSAQLALANIYNGLVRYDPVDINKVIPDLAERWEATPDAKVFTFYLRAGVKFHDGKPFTSEDAKFSLERMAFWKENKIISPRGGAMLSAVEKIETPDANSVRLTLKYPSASFLGNAASGWVLMLPKHVLQAKGDMKKDALGTGAFKWKSWNFGVSQELAKNPDYFLKGMPYLDGLIIYPIKDESTRFAAFRTGQIKMTGIASKAFTHVQAAQVRKEMGEKATVVTHPAAMRHMLFTEFKRKPWNDVRVRQAVNLAFDRQSAIKVNANVGMLGAAMHPEGAWGIPQNEMVKMIGFRQPKDEDIAKAKSLLAEAGFPSGFKTDILIRTGGISEAEGVVAKDQLARIGVDVSLKLMDSATQHDRLDQHDFDASFLLSSDPTDDPDAILVAYYKTGGSMNYGEYSDKDTDELLAKQAAMLDEKERKKIVIDIQKRILDQAVYPILFWDAYNMGFWKEVRGYKPGFGPYTHNNLDHVWLAK